MKKKILFGVLLISSTLCAQTFHKQEVQGSTDYKKNKELAVRKLRTIKPSKFGEAVPGVVTKLTSSKKIVALTFDACGGPTGNDFDKDMIDFLKREKIPATLFITGLWIEHNTELFLQLCKEPLFEIENHGYNHKPCTIGGERKYGIKGTASIAEAFDEIEMNARQIEFYAHRKPKYFRSATAYVDEGGVAVARMLNETIVGYSVLSNDATAHADTTLIKNSILKKVKPGAIVIMHMNQPKRNGLEALRLVIPLLRKQGYQFVKLEGNLLPF